ncbi:MAG: HAMP domain-containing sensor histidine kinase [Alysiella sp.]|uniref:sensor histidine kinase n=1 Tax=Alysiella sp. TaxID=1872483 RepID=UPI0026DD0191|nr:HAMP domain-containing sensor histidine kinase [Alysiella sp.]MDO4433360.1 HAMP domain-containing sensor histidine kinase [Alysiella sp.]
MTFQSSAHQLDGYTLRITKLLNAVRFAILLFVLVLLSLTNILQTHYNSLFHLGLNNNEQYLLIWCATYGFLSMFSFAKPEWQKQNISSIPNASAVIDITMMGVLAYLMGGSSSGFGILVLPFLATSCLLGYGRYPLLYGSYASIFIIWEMISRLYPLNTVFNQSVATLLFNQMLLVVAYYLVPILTSYAARHIMAETHNAQRNQLAFDRVNGLNNIIVNRMQEAAIVLDKEQYVYLLNSKAQNYFPNLKRFQHADIFQSYIKHWQRNPCKEFETFGPINGRSMYVRAIPLIQNKFELLTLFIRSENERTSEAQTIKLTALGQLTSNLAHELRNPLSAMRHASGLLNETENNNPLIKKLCGIIDNNIGRIDKMIEDISVLSKHDRANPQEINFKDYWKQFEQEFLLTCPEAKGCLKTQLPIQVAKARFDPMHLQQILWNLCNNAWRHSKKGQNAVIITLRTLDDYTLSLHIWDDGLGVPEHLRPRLFEPFFTTQKQNQGTGLGLYISRKLAQANRGELQYDVTAKAFELTLPRVQP